ncbi:MAG: hypothetical protein LBT09_03210 [Planctomycetaceae bacterium]|jgi:hypothetical protein|nr:hypothetical protein [Planctomycetaceae bacterium]
MFIRFNIFLTIIFLSICSTARFSLPNFLIAQTDNESKTVVSEVLRYRHWLAPFDKINDWPLNGERYVPMRRDLFDERINSLSDKQKESASTPKNKFTRIVMSAKLNGNQLSNGKGYFEIAQNKSTPQKTSDTTTNPQNIHSDRIILLEPWRQWINITQQNTQLICTSDGKTLLILPEQNNFRNENSVKPENMKSNSYVTQLIDFDWSMRGKVDSQDRLQFDVMFPRSLGAEFNIELPLGKMLTCSSGIVIEGEVDGQNKNSRNWKILTGTVSGVTITIANKNNPQAKKTNTAYRQSMLYNISTSGLEVTSTFLFDSKDSAIDYFEIELDSPLVSAAVHSGGEMIHSSLIEQLEFENHTLLRMDLTDIEASRRHEITIVALAPIVTSTSRADVIIDNNIWKLPRIRAVSKNLFWKETRCSLIVQRPLQTRNLSLQNCRQVRPVTDMSRSPHDTFELKYFNNDAQVGVNIYQEESRIAVDSFTQINWDDDSIAGNMIAAIRATEGKRFTFTFPISPNWAIHSIRSISGEEIFSWDIVHAKDLKLESTPNLRNNNVESYLALQLKKPLGTGELMRIQIVGRYLTDPRREFKLSEFSPILLSLQKNESHFIAIQTELPAQLQYRLQNSVLFEIRDFTDAKLQQLFLDQPEGILLPLDVRTQDIAFKSGRVRPDYTAEITGKMNIGTYNSTASFKFNIKPRETSIERIYVYFIVTKNKTENQAMNSLESSADKIQINPQTNPQQWNWKMTNPTTRPETSRTEIPQIAQSRIVKDRELDEFISALSDRKLPENFKKGELWEIRLTVPQNNPFEISASKPIAASDEIIIPFAVLPAALSQHGEIYIESDEQFPYTVSGNNLKSIPTNISNRNSNRYTRAAFKFDPIDAMKHSNESALKLLRINMANAPPEAWIWLMKMESQYGIDGVVKSCINFHIESRGKELLQIKLPDGINVDDVGVVWIDNKQTTWRSHSPQTLIVAMPPFDRYVTVSVEFSYKNYDLQTVTEITPKYPETDIPVLSKSCIAWFHPDYKIVKPSDKFRVSSFFEQDISNVSAYLFGQNKNEHKAMSALQCFNEWVSQTTENQSTNQPTIQSTNQSENQLTDRLELTWQQLSGDEKRFSELLLQKIKTEFGDEFYDMPDVRFYVDMLGFSSQGITAQSIVASINKSSGVSVGNGLTIFISVKTTADGRDEYSFYFTTFLTAGVFQYFNGKQIGDCVWFTDDENLAKFIIAGAENAAGKIYESIPSATVGKPQILKVSDWIRAVQKTENVHWSDTNQSFRQGNISPDWVAYEISGDGGGTYFIVRSNLLKNYYLVAFLVVVVLSCKHFFSRPVLLIFVMIASQILQYFLPPSYSAVFGGIFAGAVVAFVLVLIRINLFNQNKTQKTNNQSQSNSNEKIPAE